MIGLVAAYLNGLVWLWMRQAHADGRLRLRQKPAWRFPDFPGGDT